MRTEMMGCPLKAGLVCEHLWSGGEGGSIQHFPHFSGSEVQTAVQRLREWIRLFLCPAHAALMEGFIHGLTPRGRQRARAAFARGARAPRQRRVGVRTRVRPSAAPGAPPTVALRPGELAAAVACFQTLCPSDRASPPQR